MGFISPFHRAMAEIFTLKMKMTVIATISEGM